MPLLEVLAVAEVASIGSEAVAANCCKHSRTEAACSMARWIDDYCSCCINLFPCYRVNFLCSHDVVDDAYCPDAGLEQH